MLIILLISFLAELTLALIITKFDILSPSVIVSAVMTASSVLAVISNSYWQITIHQNTVLILTSGVFFFIIGDLCGALFFANKSKKKDVFISHIEIDNGVLFFVFCFGLVTVAWHLKFVMSNTGIVTSFTQMTSSYRMDVLRGTLDNKMPGMLNRFITFNMYLAYLFTYVFVHNCITSKRFKKNLKLLIPVAVFFVDSIIDAARGYLVNWVIALVVYYYLVNVRLNGWKLRNTIRSTKNILIVFAAGAIAFTLLGTIVGRSDEYGIVYRIAQYAGGGIILFDLYLNQTPVFSKVPGEYTFTAMNKYIYRHFHIEKYDYIRFLEFRYHKGYNMGNVYTAFRPYHQDYGYIGMVILTILFALFFSVFYRSIVNNHLKSNFSFKLYLYGYMANAMFLFSFDDKFFSTYAAPSFITNIIIMFCLSMLVLNIRIKNFKIRFSSNRNKIRFDRRLIKDIIKRT
ncbi:MAG: oligosaccharide repeat unit polymerase [Ruminococcus sp.]|nr:oligosaccharide repeat unit polymerase [Ruminococcus sp.]